MTKFTHYYTIIDIMQISAKSTQNLGSILKPLRNTSIHVLRESSLSGNHSMNTIITFQKKKKQNTISY